jgi:hypothetical protein
VATSFRTFIDNIEALVVVGITRAYVQGPPAKLETANLPAQWVQLPSANEGPVVLSGSQGGWPTIRALLVVAYEAVGQSRQGDNFDSTVNMMDAINTAIRATPTAWPGAGHCTWEMRQGKATVAGEDYWAVFVDIEGTG